MGLPFINGKDRKRDQLVAIDLGGRTTKAVHIQKRNEEVALVRYAVLDAPVQKSFSVDVFTEHFKTVMEALETKTRSVALAVGVSESLVRHAELPQMPIPDMRQILKMNPKAYLQQDLSNHLFDCHVIPPRQTPKADEKARLDEG